MTTRHTIARIRANRRTDSLARELGEFRSQADLAELSALLDRHSDAETESLRELVDLTAAA